MTKLNEHIENQKELIGLLLKHKDLVGKFINSPVKIKDFHEGHRPILTEIIKAYNQGYLLTRKGFRDDINNIVVPKKKIAQELAFDSCYIRRSDNRDLFLPLIKSIHKLR